MDNANDTVLQSAMVQPGKKKEGRLGTKIVMRAKVRIGKQWFIVDFLTLLSMSGKVRSLHKYLYEDEYGFALVELDDAPTGAKEEHFPEFMLQIKGFPTSEITENNLFDFVGWHRYMDVLPGIQKCDKILRTMIKAQWMSIKNNDVLKDYLGIIDRFLDLVDCAIAYHCERSLKEINRIICRWQFGCGERIVGSALSCKQWKRLFEFTKHDATIRDNVIDWVKTVNGELPDAKFNLFDEVMPHLTMSNIRQRVLTKGVAKMGEVGVLNHHRDLVKALEKPNKLVRYKLPNHTMVLHSYGRKESEDEGATDGKPPKLSGDVSASIKRARDEVAQDVRMWKAKVPKTDD